MAFESSRLRINSNNSSSYLFRISIDERTSDGLEHRTWHVLERLATETRLNMIRSVVSSSSYWSSTTYSDDIIGSDTDWMIDVDLRRKLETEMDPKSTEWGTAFVLLGELGTLSILRERAERMKLVLLDKKRLTGAT